MDEKISRRQLLAAAPAMGLTAAFLQAADIEAQTPITAGAALDGPFVYQYKDGEGHVWPLVQFLNYKGFSEDNKIDSNWATEVLRGKPTIIDIPHLLGISTLIYRTRATCWLHQLQAAYFTAIGYEEWKTGYLWYGPVNLVRDVIIRLPCGTETYNKVDIELYLCRTEDSIQGRKLEPGEKPPEKWIHL